MKKLNILVLIVVLIAFATGFFIASSDLISQEEVKLGPHLAKSVRQEFFTCPMHPHIHEEHEGNCPICGMSLVKKKVNLLKPGEKGASNQPEIYIKPSVINNFGIKTDKVIRDNISNNLKIYGYVNKVKTPELILLRSPVAGSVRFINKAGMDNKFYKNEIVISLKSDEVSGLQKRYLNAIKINDVKAIKQLKHKLNKLGYDFEQLKYLVKTQKVSNVFMIRYPDTGLLNNLKVKLSQELKAGELIGELRPLYSVSAVARVYESQWIWLKVGQKISMKSRSLPGSVWNGELRSLGGLGQSSTTAVKLVADFEENKDIELRLGMQTEMTVYTQSKVDVLQVPSTAVIHTGTKAIVILAKGDGYFQPIDVEIGLDNSEYTEITSGLIEGMEVVVSGQFLLDSESQLSAEITRMTLSD